MGEVFDDGAQISALYCRQRTHPTPGLMVAWDQRSSAMFITPDAALPPDQIARRRTARLVLTYWPFPLLGLAVLGRYIGTFEVMPLSFLGFMYLMILVDIAVSVIFSIICTIDRDWRMLAIFNANRIAMGILLRLAAIGWFGDRFPTGPAEALRALGS